MDYTILRRGQLDGPYSEEEVQQMMTDGRLSGQDLAQTPVSYYWTPLRNLLAVEETEDGEPPIRATPFREFTRDIAESVRRLFEHSPLETGLLCLAIGCVVVVLGALGSLLMYGPWLLAALMAGALLILRGQKVAGIALCAGAIFLPLGLGILMH